MGSAVVGWIVPACSCRADSRGDQRACRSLLQEVPEQYAAVTLLLFSKQNLLRRMAIRLTTHKFYERFTLVLIMVSCATLVVDR